MKLDEICFRYFFEISHSKVKVPNSFVAVKCAHKHTHAKSWQYLALKYHYLQRYLRLVAIDWACFCPHLVDVNRGTSN